MNTRTFKFSAGLFASVLLATLGHAQTITATEALPGSNLGPTGTPPNHVTSEYYLDAEPSTDVTINGSVPTGQFDPTNGDPIYAPGPLNFSNTFTVLPTINDIAITLGLVNLDTMTGGTFNNDIDLTLNGIDTGILLNGFNHSQNTVSTQTFNVAISSTIGQQILTSLENPNNSAGGVGLLNVGVLNTNYNNVGDDQFGIAGGSVSLSLEDTTPVPFTPSPLLGLIVCVGLGAYAYRRHSRQLVAVTA
jgi:hypothetical protein